MKSLCGFMTDSSRMKSMLESLWVNDQKLILNIVKYVFSLSLAMQIPPAPPKPNFDEPRHKLAKLREGKLLV